MWSLAVKNTRELWRDKKLFVIAVLFPVILLFLSHFFFKHTQSYFERIPLAVVNPEKNFPKVGRLLVTALTKIKSRQSERELFHVMELSRGEAFQALQQGKVSAILFIPKQTTEMLQHQKPVRLVLFSNEKDRRSMILSSTLGTFVEHFGFLVEKSQGRAHKELITLSFFSHEFNALHPELESLSNLLIFALIFLIPYAAGQWVSELEKGSFARFRLARFSPWALLSGTFVSVIFLGGVQVALLLTAGTVLGFNLRFLWVWVWPVVFVLALAAEGLGLVFSSFLEKEKQLHIVSSLFLIPIYFLSGTLGKEVFGPWLLNILPWQGGYSIFASSLMLQVPDYVVLFKMSFSSLVILTVGVGFFSIKRFRYG